jgi:YbgC/YbaW family acyl-CoA thioester hydrolase
VTRVLPFTHDDLRAAPHALFSLQRSARFHDVDAALTVFFPRYFEYASDVANDFLCARGIDVPQVVKTQQWLAPLAHVEADFAAPVRYGDAFVIEVVATHAGTTSYGFGCRMRRADASAEHLATIIMMHVCIDPKRFRPEPLPDALRRALTV